MEQSLNKHEIALNFLEEEFNKHGFTRIKDHFYIEMDNLFGFLKYRKHTIITPSFFIDIGIFFKEYESWKKVPYHTKRWHLDGVIGSLNTDLRTRISLNEYSEEELRLVSEKFSETVKEKWLPLLMSYNDKKYLKENYPHNFNLNILFAHGTEKHELLIEFIKTSK